MASLESTYTKQSKINVLWNRFVEVLYFLVNWTFEYYYSLRITFGKKDKTVQQKYSAKDKLTN